MHSKIHPELFLINILVCIDKIMRNNKNLSFAQFVEDERTFGFTIRELQEIGESVKKLLDAQYLQEISNIEWQKIVDFRNVVVHKYFGIVPEIVAEIVEKEVPLLEENVINLIKKQKDKTLLLQALQDTKHVYSKMNRHETVSYLEKIEALLS